MKKLLICLFCFIMILGLTSCWGKKDEVQVMTYDEYMAAEFDSEVVVEAYVQATQSWWYDSKVGQGKITVYAADEDGAYFIYEMPCSEEEAAKLTAGTKIRVTGYKADWEGEIEIVDATFEFLEADPYIAEATNVTTLLGTDKLIDYQNQLVRFNGLFVKEIEYKGGKSGDDIYVTVTYKGADYDFCVERYLTGPESDVYKAVEALEVGDVIDVEGFLYWYEGVNTHITAVTAYDVDSYADYDAAAIDERVAVDVYVQATQSWWDNKITVYAADEDGAYFLYEMACSEADAAKLTKGAKIRVTGYKAEWSGEVEIVDCHFIALDGTYVAEATEAVLDDENLIKKQNQLVFFNGLTVKKIEYKGGERGDDVYLTVTYNGADYDFCVERYLTGPDTEVYQAVEALKEGDVIDVEAFLYWYNGANPHITKVTVK